MIRTQHLCQPAALFVLSLAVLAPDAAWGAARLVRDIHDQVGASLTQLSFRR